MRFRIIPKRHPVNPFATLAPGPLADVGPAPRSLAMRGVDNSQNFLYLIPHTLFLILACNQAVTSSVSLYKRFIECHCEQKASGPEAI